MVRWQLTKALWKSDVEWPERFEVVQLIFDAAYSDDVVDSLDVCADRDLVVCSYSALGERVLPVNTNRCEDGPRSMTGLDDSRAPVGGQFDEWYASACWWCVLDELRAVADELYATPTQVPI